MKQLITCLILFACLCRLSSGAQVNQTLFLPDIAIDSAKTQQLRLNIRSMNFFKNNEYSRQYTSGYTLPGVSLVASLSYQPLPNARIELGAYTLKYWGATVYPAMAYRDIPVWKGRQFQKGAHVVPLVRAQLKLSPSLEVVLGALKGKAFHGLAEPLYNPELNVMADPETGLQFVYRSTYVDVDTWVNWESFIFREDVHNESFVFGLTSSIRLNREGSPLHFYLPIQAVAHHRGGELDTITTHSAYSTFNLAAGIGMQSDRGIPLRLQVMALSYNQSEGYDVFAYDKGHAFYAMAETCWKHFDVKAAYWYCNRFISILGSPFFSAADVFDRTTRFERSQFFQLSGQYNLLQSNGIAFGASADTYWGIGRRAGFSHALGVYLRINQSFLLRNFRKQKGGT